MIKVAFDIDDTIWKCRYKTADGRVRMDQVPDYDIIQLVKWFYNNGDEVYFWSAGGVDYCETVIMNLGLDDYGKVIEKKIGQDIDISFDDNKVELAKTNIQVRRETPEYMIEQEVKKNGGKLNK